MPTKKPQLKCYTEPEIVHKFSIIAAIESRSVSKELEYIVKRYIDEHEQKNGEIKVGNTMGE